MWIFCHLSRHESILLKRYSQNILITNLKSDSHGDANSRSGNAKRFFHLIFNGYIFSINFRPAIEFSESFSGNYKPSAPVCTTNWELRLYMRNMKESSLSLLSINFFFLHYLFLGVVFLPIRIYFRYYFSPDWSKVPIFFTIF